MLIYWIICSIYYYCTNYVNNNVTLSEQQCGGCDKTQKHYIQEKKMEQQQQKIT